MNKQSTTMMKQASTKTINTSGGLAPTMSRKILLATTLGDMVLYFLFRGEIPHRDYVACRVGIGVILALTAFESKTKSNRPRTNRFRSIFAALSTMELFFTVLVPWLIILEGIFNKSQTQKNGHLLASHLFIFQAQIAGECMITLTGENRKWLLFPFTCVANAYRAVSIGTWVMRVMDEDVLENRDIILPVIAGALWLYSSFVFIPREWFPLLKKL